MQGRIRFKHDTGHARDASTLDKERSQLQAYEYLCHIGEAKEWIEAVIKEQIAPIEELDEELRNGIELAKVAKSFSPGSVKRIFEDRNKLQFRHSDNINYLFDAMKKVGLPDVFFFELTDLYEKKNIPKVIYCIHALGHLLFKKGLAPPMSNLVGKLSFTDEQLDATQQSLDESGVTMPSFGSVGDALAKELKETPPLTDEQSGHYSGIPLKTVDLLKYLTERFMTFEENIPLVVRCQAVGRGRIARRRYKSLIARHRAEQARLKAEQARLRAEEERRYLEKVVTTQSVVRMHQARKSYLNRQQHFKDNQSKITRIQAGWRAKKAREAHMKRMDELKAKDELWARLQARVKGAKVRQRYLDRVNYLNSRTDEIVKIQAMWRAKKMAKAYRGLSSLNNPDIKILQSFLHLLDDSDEDFEEELEIERLRQLVVKKIRENISTEQEVNDLDVKISLLVKNRISLEEVIHATTKKKRALLSEALLQGDKDSSNWNLNGRDKENRARRERYAELFYLLQTQPQYLAKLMFSLNKKSGGTVTKFLEQIVLSLYGYAQNMREEYLLLNLIKSAISIEIDEISKLDEFWRANPLFIKLVLQYTRGAKNVQFLRDLLGPLVKSVLTDTSLDLETDPISIWKSLIREEESRTGEKSSRAYDPKPQQAAADPEVKAIQLKHTNKLKEITDRFLTAMIGSLKNMPFGIRYIAMEMKEIMRTKFPGNDDEIIKIVGNLLYYRYMNPAIVAPEAFDVIETGANISPVQRKNLADVARLLHQISVGKTVQSAGDEATEAMNTYVQAASKKFYAYFKEASTVVTAEEYFNMDEYVDMGRAQKPVIYISPSEIFQMHRALLENMDDLVTEEKDPLKQILDDIGQPPAPQPSEGPGSEIALALTNRFTKLEGEKETRLKQLFTETKRYVLAIVRVQSGKNLLDILEMPVTEREETAFIELTKKEIEMNATRREIERRQTKKIMPASPSVQAGLAAEAKEVAGSPGSTTSPLTPASGPSIPHSQSTLFAASKDSLLRGPDGSAITFFQLKRRALENMAKLEVDGLVTKANSYQDMVNSIAKDMLNKHRRRSQRRRELESLRQTLKNLDEKAAFLDEQKKSYHSYIDACMAQLGSKTSKGKKKPMIFTKQYYHMRELQKTGGKVPQFGSFKYSAADLHKKGVLLGIDDYSPRQYGGITLTISSDEAGVFKVEASFLGLKMPETMELRLEDLLASQYNNVSVMTLFEGAKVNVNLLIFLLNKK
ncbi:hypothetical protein HK104_005630 [Borealophlyctis nickersoniae]|nr:hypothetical protein HK104_005630 [Borealophlyctis nickersoniae]